MASEAESEKSDAQPKSKKKTMVLIIVALGLCVVGGGAYWFFIAAKTKPSPEVEKKLVMSFIDLKDMVIGIQPERNDQSERPRFLKIKISLELADSQEITKIQPLMPRVEDIFQTYLRELRPADLQGTAGLIYLKEELLKRVNIVVAPGRVQAILFKEIAVQ